LIAYSIKTGTLVIVGELVGRTTLALYLAKNLLLKPWYKTWYTIKTSLIKYLLFKTWIKTWYTVKISLIKYKFQNIKLFGDQREISRWGGLQKSSTLGFHFTSKEITD